MTHLADAAGMMLGNDQRMNWASLLAAVVLSWLAVALVVGTLVGHGIAFGTQSDSD